MNTIMAIAIGCSYSGTELTRSQGTRTMWDCLQPHTEMRAWGWHLPFHDRVKLETSGRYALGFEKPRNMTHRDSPSYIRHMKDAGRGRLL